MESPLWRQVHQVSEETLTRKRVSSTGNAECMGGVNPPVWDRQWCDGPRGQTHSRETRGVGHGLSLDHADEVPTKTELDVSLPGTAMDSVKLRRGPEVVVYVQTALQGLLWNWTRTSLCEGLRGTQSN